MDRATPPTPETRLSVRLSGPLAEHANRQVETELYSSHSEYIRDLIRRDMVEEKEASVTVYGAHQGGDEELVASIRRGLADVVAGRYEPYDSETFRKELEADLKARLLT
jgi:Arc/MetJ-type ribon-helix-helix transcriptional regulator